MMLDPNLVSAARNMIRLRYWQHILNEMLKQRRFKIPVHLAFGHEAVAVALAGVTSSADSVSVTHRNVLYNLARQDDLRRVLKLYDSTKSSPLSSMGSMNLALDESGISYASSILGNNLAVAAGLAMSRKFLGGSGVSFATTGDGAIEEGVFWEVLLHARSHDLPLVILVEDNDFSLASAIAERRCAINLSSVCGGVGISYCEVSGADYVEIENSLRSARSEALSGQPACVLVRLKKFCQHAGPTPGWPEDPMEINLSNGLILEESLEDPIFNIQQLIGEKIFRELEGSVLTNEYL